MQFFRISINGAGFVPSSERISRNITAVAYPQARRRTLRKGIEILVEDGFWDIILVVPGCYVKQSDVSVTARK